MLGAGKVYNSSSIVHGGIIGYFLSVPLYTLFGKLGSYIIFIAIYIISITLIKDITIKDMILGIKDKKISLKETNSKNKDKLLLSEDLKENIIEASSIPKENTDYKIKIIDFLKSTEPNENNKEEKISPQNHIKQEKSHSPISESAFDDHHRKHSH